MKIENDRAPEAIASQLLFVTDLDGTLLDEETYSFAPALPALQRLLRSGALLVLASSKTAPEMEPLARELGLRSPLIVENGGAVLLPREGGAYETIVLGVERDALTRALAEIASETGASPRGFSVMHREELMRETNLDAESAARAVQRSWDEPFLLADQSRAAALAAAAERRGLRVSRGGRFFHLTGDSDKGKALRRLLEILEAGGRSFGTVGLGDAANDIPLLRAVARPILVPRPGGRLDPALAAALPAAERAPAPGPEGWNEAVLAVLEGRRLASVADAKAEPR